MEIGAAALASSIYPSNSIPSATTSNNFAVSRPFSQQMLTPMTPDLETNMSSNSANLSTQQAQQRRQVIHHLALLLHAHKCLQREQQANCNGENHVTSTQYSCTLPHCASMRTVLQHMTKCSDFKTCTCKFAANGEIFFPETDRSSFSFS